MKARMPAGFGRPDMNSLMRQAQKMQEDMKAKQAELEAAEYTGIGRTKIRQIIMRGDCPFAVTNGVQVCVIRDKFIDYLDKQFSI